MKLDDLKQMLLDRDYPEGLIDSDLDKARKVPRDAALKRVIKKKQKNRQRPVFAVKYDQRLPSITNTQTKHWRLMTFQVKYMEEVFLEPPITSHQPGQTLANLKATILELVNKHDEEYRKEREHFYIIIFNSFHDGMNKKN